MISGGGRLAGIGGAYIYSCTDSSNFGLLTWQYHFYSYFDKVIANKADEHAAPDFVVVQALGFGLEREPL